MMASCSAPTLSPPQTHSLSKVIDGSQNKPVANDFKVQSTTVDPPPQLEEVSQIPPNPHYQVRFQTGAPTSNTIQMPVTGPFKLNVQAGDTFAILDADATDGSAKIQMPAHVMDLYVQAQQIRTPSLCQSAYDTHKSTQDYFQKLILNKANDLIAQSKSQCVYQPENTASTCQSSSSGLNCTGKSLPLSTCPEMAVLANSLNIQHDVSASKIFAYTQNGITLNHSAKGVLSSAGNIQTDLNGNRVFEGVLVGARSQQFNLNGTPQFKGLFHLTDAQTATGTLKGNSQVEGAICPSGSFNLNRNGNTRVIYQPQTLVPWLNDVGNLAHVLCDAQSNLYTQTNPKSCPPPVPPASLQIKDPLYVIDQTIQTNIDDSAYYLARRPVPVPADWYGPEGQNYVLEFNNQGMTAINTYWFEKNASALFPHSVNLTPKVDCVQQNRLGTYTAYLGYENAMPGTITIPAGEYNSLLPADNAGQPTQFAVGISPAYPQSIYAVSFVGEQLSWKLGTQTLNIHAKDPELQCPQEAITVPSNVSVRKTLLETTSLNFGAGQQTQILPFNVNDPVDLKRRILLTVKTGTQGNPVDKLEVRVNGQVLAPGFPNQTLIDSVFPEVTFEVLGLLKNGNNILEITANSSSNSHATVRLDAFMLPINIPGALHSAINHSEEVRRQEIVQGRVYVKFLEGMKVRLQGETLADLKDQSELSLSILKVALGNTLTSIQMAIPGEATTHDSSEQILETQLNQELPNQNLFYLLTFDPSQNVWDIVDRLKIMPFVEEAFPEFIPEETAAYVPNERVSPNPNPLAELDDAAKREWLENTRILNKDPANPHTQPGAWDITRGAGVKIAILERGFKHSTFGMTTHPDLRNVNYKANVQVNSGYTELRHGTATTGILAATGNNSEGIAGVAHEAEVTHIHYANPQQSLPSLCLGTGQVNCDYFLDAVELALKLNSKVIVVEASDGGTNPGTIETNSLTRTRFTYLINDPNIKTKYGFNPTIVIPAGNRACEIIPEATVSSPHAPWDGLAEIILKASKTDCFNKWKNGKDIRELVTEEPVYDFTWTLTVGAIVAIFPFNLIPAIALANYKPSTSSYVEKIQPMPDTGTIIVGALNIKGNQMVPPSINVFTGLLEPIYNHGKSNAQAHGTDVSAPSEKVFTTHSTKVDSNCKSNLSGIDYCNFAGTSAATPIVGGVAALILSQKPEITPKEIRQILRDTAQNLPSGEDISGMVDAYKSVCKANPDAPACGTGTDGFSTASLSESIPENASPAVSLWLLRGGAKIAVEPDQEVGIGINYPDLSGVDIQIDGQSMPIRQLANNYLTFGIPTDMTPGTKDVIIKLAGGSVTLEQALEIISLAGLPKVSFTMPENTIYSNGSFWKDVYVKIRNDAGQALNAGVPIYVSGLTTGVLSNHQLMDPINNKLWTHEGLFYTDANGQIHLKYKVNATVQASQYGDMWPTPTSPNTRFRICNYTYRSSKPGWGGDCLKQLFPNSPEPSNEGRLFWVGPASARIEPSYIDMVMNGSTYAMSIKDVRDKAGNTLPDGTSIYLAYPYWLSGSGERIFPEEGQNYYVQSGGRTFARLVVRGGQANFTVKTPSIPCWGGNEVTRDTWALVGTFNSKIENPLNWIATGTIQYLAQPGC